MSVLIGIPFVALSVLSFVGCFLIFVRLYSTESKAPSLAESLRGMRDCQEIVNDPTPLVSVIVPARNEEKLVARCIQSVLGQSYMNFELIVIDDSSEDRTREVVNGFRSEDRRVRLIQAGEKPPEWVGKNWPCWKGYQESRGDFLLFIDADSVYDRRTIESALLYAIAKRYDVLSISPKVKLEGLWSHSTLPLLSGIINLLYPMTDVNDSKSRKAYVFGSFFFIRKDVYKSIGGHKATKTRIVEDAAIGENAKWAGHPLRIEIGNEFSTTDWESQFLSIFHGLERVSSHSIRNHGLVSIVNAVLFFFVGLFPLFMLAWFFLPMTARLLNGGQISIVPVVAAIIAMSALSILFLLATVTRELRLAVGRAGIYPVLYPLGCVLFIAAIITTSVKVATGRTIEWKGSKYAQRKRK